MDRYRRKFVRSYSRDILSLDEFNAKSLTALRTKLIRDYIGFFGSIGALYKRGERKNEISYILGKIKRMISTIDNAVQYGSVSRKDVESLVDEIDDINESKDVFLEEIESSRALRSRVEKVTKETGISPGDLNITREYAKGTGEAAKETTLGMLKKALPRTIERTQEIKEGLKGALMGPFAPLYDVLKGGFGDVTGFLRKRSEKKLERQLVPSAFSGTASGMEMPDFGQSLIKGIGKDDRGRGPTSLFEFFDKTAYRAKYTRELLSVIKGRRGIAEGSAFGGMLGGVGKLGEMLPMLLKFGALAAVSGFTIYEVSKLIGTIKEFYNVKKEAGKQVEKQVGLREQFQDRYVQARVAKIDEMNISDERKRALKVQAYKQVGSEFTAGKTEVYKAKTSWIGQQFDYLKQGYGITAPKPMQPTVIPSTREIPKIPTTTSTPGVDNRTMDKLSKNIDKLSDSIDKDKQIPGIKPSNMPTRYDSADPLVNSLASGKLSIGN